MHSLRLPSTLALALAGLFWLGPMPASADTAERPVAKVLKVSGGVTGRPPKSEAYGRLEAGDRVPYGSRIRTDDTGKATLEFADGTKVRVRSKSEVLVRPRPTKQASSVVLFFGRVWSKVVKSVGGKTSFEVESANAVAGVRGTEFEVGVADDGSTRVIVTEGLVGVGGDVGGKPTSIGAGYEVESNASGSLARRRKSRRNPGWKRWFSKRAKRLERRGLVVARDLRGRLDKRQAKVQRLVKRQRALRQAIERLERRRGGGEAVDEALQGKLEELEHVTARLEDMKDRLQATFGMFERWSEVAASGTMADSEQVGLLAQDVQRVAAQFADMVEEGTDLSEDGMHEMMDDMKKGGTLRPE